MGKDVRDLQENGTVFNRGILTEINQAQKCSELGFYHRLLEYTFKQ